jgi:hypothetical protein
MLLQGCISVCNEVNTAQLSLRCIEKFNGERTIFSRMIASILGNAFCAAGGTDFQDQPWASK